MSDKKTLNFIKSYWYKIMKKNTPSTTPAEAPEATETAKTTETAATDAPPSEEAAAEMPESIPAEEAAPETADETAPEAPTVDEKALAEAEQRGYLRGRNERIEELMRAPAPLSRRQAPTAAAADSEPMILSTPRVSIWDK